MFRSCLSGIVLGPTLGPLSPQWSRSGGPLGPLKASLGALWRPLGSISGPWALFAVSFLHQTFTPQASICIVGGKPATYYLLLLYPGQAECAKRLNNDEGDVADGDDDNSDDEAGVLTPLIMANWKWEAAVQG